MSGTNRLSKVKIPKTKAYFGFLAVALYVSLFATAFLIEKSSEGYNLSVFFILLGPMNFVFLNPSDAWVGPVLCSTVPWAIGLVARNKLLQYAALGCGVLLWLFLGVIGQSLQT